MKLKGTGTFICHDRYGSPSDVYAYQQAVPVIQQLNFASIVLPVRESGAKSQN